MLSPRQAECLRLLATGASDRDIAATMQVKITTARQHVLDVRDKLGANNRSHAVVIGYRKGLLK
jgi:DNA-binding CsgD family transcriptional regulator